MARLKPGVKVLFVCSGNLIRSPFAARYCQTLAVREGISIDVRSAGTLAGISGSPPPAAVEAARTRQIDLSDHRSIAVSRPLAGWADVILVMDAGHRAILRDRCPEATGKVFFLSSLTGWMPERDIRDPLGRPAEVMSAAFARIERAVEALADACRAASPNRKTSDR